MEDYLPIPQISHMPFIFQNNAKCTYFQPKIYLRVPKMYLVNNVLENQIWAVPLLKGCYDPPPTLIISVIMTIQTQGVCKQELPETVDLKM